MRRMRNRTLTGLETMRLVEQLRPGSATGSRPITPSFNTDKDMLMAQQFIDFNPAGKVKLLVFVVVFLFAAIEGVILVIVVVVDCIKGAIEVLQYL